MKKAALYRDFSPKIGVYPLLPPSRANAVEAVFSRMQALHALSQRPLLPLPLFYQLGRGVVCLFSKFPPLETLSGTFLRRRDYSSTNILSGSLDFQLRFFPLLARSFRVSPICPRGLRSSNCLSFFFHFFFFFFPMVDVWRAFLHSRRSFFFSLYVLIPSQSLMISPWESLFSLAVRCPHSIMYPFSHLFSPWAIDVSSGVLNMALFSAPSVPRFR